MFYSIICFCAFIVLVKKQINFVKHVMFLSDEKKLKITDKHVRCQYSPSPNISFCQTHPLYPFKGRIKNYKLFTLGFKASYPPPPIRMNLDKLDIIQHKDLLYTFTLIHLKHIFISIKKNFSQDIDYVLLNMMHIYIHFAPITYTPLKKAAPPSPCATKVNCIPCFFFALP